MSALLRQRGFFQSNWKIAAFGCVAGSSSATGRGSRPCIPGRSRSPSGTDGMAVNGTVGTGARLARGSALALACLLVLGACSSINLGPTPQVVSLSSGPTGKPAERQGPATAAEREHQRILTAYNGPYDDPRLEAMVNKTIAKLVAASDQPEMQYRVVILNSPAV